MEGSWSRRLRSRSANWWPAWGGVAHLGHRGVEDAEFEAQARNCHVHGEIPGGDWSVRGNASLLRSAVENVVRNAIRYTQEKSSVEVELLKEARAGVNEAVLRVSDSGPGVPASALGKLFEPFY